MAKIACTEPRNGVKTCKVTSGPDKGRTFRAHTEATAGTRAKRARAAGRLRRYQFKKSDFVGCPSLRGKTGAALKKARKARGQCAAAKVERRVDG